MPEAGVRQVSPPICPRCGYDQSGVVATWTRMCPLHGVCSECGLELRWAAVLSPDVMGPRWSAEHGSRLTIGRCARAWWRGVVQGRLWREFDLAYPLRPARLWALAIVSVVVHHVCFAAAVAIGHAVELRALGWSVQPPWAPSLWLFPYDDDLVLPLGAATTVEIPTGPVALLIACAVAVPALLLLIFTETMSRVGVRRAHVLRGLAYMAPAMGPAALAVLALLGGTVIAGSSSPGSPLSAAAALAVVLAWPLWQVVRWRAFVKHYLRLPHATWIALSMLIILGLTFVTAVVIIGSFVGW